MTGSSVLDVLAEAQHRGFIGPGLLEPHLARSLAFRDAVGDDAKHQVVDLGTGGGLPGLVLADAWTVSRFRLLEASQRRSAFLRAAVRRLDLADRVVVDERRAEEAGRDPVCRAAADLVVARSFGRPAVTAECAAPLLRRGGLLVVAEPPDVAPNRWAVTALGRLGLVRDEIQVPGFVRLRQAELCSARYPRRIGIPAKRPLF